MTISRPLKPAMLRLLALSLLILIAPVTRAQDGDRDPPTVAARVVEVVGDAWLFDHDNREWTRLTRNQTVGEGDRLRTDDRARLSLRLGSTTIWIDQRSDVELSEMDEGQTLLQVDRGNVALRLRNSRNATETRLVTREGTALPEREGLYRVEQLDSGSKAYVWQGRLRFEWARGAAPVMVGAGEQVELWWPDGPRAERSALYGDDFGNWVVAESRSEGDGAVARYVSPEMTGADDLDRYGRWETAPDYGAVWIPTVIAVADWAPYRYGHWAWSRLWGWTWVDDAPWGFAPFHYGRWVQWRGRWCWSPGAYVARPAYAPALVGWVGGGTVSIGISVGSRPPPPRYGWYPLAPREVFVPAYHHSPRYVGRINDPRDLRDPVTVKRPNRYHDVPAAISTLPAQGGRIEALPVRSDRRGDASWARPLPTAPGRGDLGAMLPAVPTRPADAQPPRRIDRQPDRDPGWRGNGPTRRDEANRPQPPAVVQTPQPPAAQQPSRGGDMPWRAQPQRDDPQRRDDLQRQRDDQQRQQQMQEQQRRDQAQQQMQRQRDEQQRQQQMQEQEQQRRDQVQQQMQRQRDEQQRQQQAQEQQRREQMQQQQMQQQQAQQRQMEQQRREEAQRRMPPPQEQPRAQVPQRQDRSEGPQRQDRRERQPQKQDDR